MTDRTIDVRGRRFECHEALGCQLRHGEAVLLRETGTWAFARVVGYGRQNSVKVQRWFSERKRWSERPIAIKRDESVWRIHGGDASRAV